MNNFPMSILIADELYTASTRIDKIVSDAAIKDIYIAALQGVIKPSIIDMAVALGKDKESEFTNLLANYDEKRDSFFEGFREHCSSFTNHYDENIKKAAQLLVDAIMKRGWGLQNYGYALETAQINVLLKDLDNKKEKEAVELIGAGFWIEKLTAAHSDFENTVVKRATTESKETTLLVGDVRKKLTRYIDALLNYIDMNAELNGNPFKSLEKDLDEVIVDTTSVARARRTRKENKTEDEQE